MAHYAMLYEEARWPFEESKMKRFIHGLTNEMIAFNKCNIHAFAVVNQ